MSIETDNADSKTHKLSVKHLMSAAKHERCQLKLIMQSAKHKSCQ